MKSSPTGNGDARLFSDAEWAEITHGLRLSPQQERIVALLLDGLCDKQIAQALGRRVPTVPTHMGRLFLKVGVHDRCELLREVFREFRRGCHLCPRHQERLH